MAVVYGRFEKPKKVLVEGEDERQGHFVIEPLERGFGHTLGNALRRMMMTSIEAPAIISVGIEGVLHEYQAIEGIVEDMINIVLNFKGALLRRIPMEDEVAARAERHLTETIEITGADLAATGQHVVTLGDLIPEGGEFEIINPDLPLFTVTKPMKKSIDIRIAMGRGYVPSERLQSEGRGEHEIALDGLFSPVRLVRYNVIDTRVGQHTDFDRLELEVQTDGRVTPKEALSFASDILNTHLDIFSDIGEPPVAYEREEVKVDTDKQALLDRLSRRIGDIELSVRSTNCLNGAGIRYIGELVVMQESDMLRFRNFGKKSLGEIRDKLYEMGLNFDMRKTLRDNDIDPENLIGAIEAFLAERAAASFEGEAGMGNEGSVRRASAEGGDSSSSNEFSND